MKTKIEHKHLKTISEMAVSLLESYLRDGDVLHPTVKNNILEIMQYPDFPLTEKTKIEQLFKVL